MGVNVQASAQWCCAACQARNPGNWARCWRCYVERQVVPPASYASVFVVGVVTVATALGLVLQRTIRRWR